MNISTIIVILGIVVLEDLHVEYLDVKTTFLHDNLDEDTYMVQSEGFQIVGKEKIGVQTKEKICMAVDIGN